MEAQKQDYHISFFKPTTPQAKANRNMVLWLVLVWVVAIFGFQILLKVLEKPTPETAYTEYKAVWEDVKNETASQEQLSSFAKSTLSVLGKVFITADEKAVLENALSWSFYQISDPGVQEEITEFQAYEKSIEDIQDKDYVATKLKLESNLSPVLALEKSDVRRKFLPLSLDAKGMNEFTQENKDALPAIMDKYLIHNQSALTDIVFLGFPFHYFYTAVFLLVLFVFLCWIYSVRTDALNKQFGKED